MVDIATLGYKVDTTSLTAGTTALDQHAAAAKNLAGAAGPAQAAAAGIGAAAASAAPGVNQLGNALNSAAGAVGGGGGVGGGGIPGGSAPAPGGGFVPALQRVGAASGAARGAISNLTFQVNDVAQAVALGVNPMTLMAQQGFQVAQVMMQLGQSGVGGVAAVGQAFRSLITPMSLISLGVVGLIGVAGQLVTSWLSGSDDMEDANDMLADSVDRLKEAYGETTKAVEALTEAERNRMLLNAQDQLRAQTEILEREQGDINAGIRTNYLGAGAMTDIWDEPEALAGFQNAFNNFIISMGDGTMNIADFRDELERLKTEFQDSNDVRTLADRILGNLNEGAEAEETVGQLRDLILALSDAETVEAEAARERLGIMTSLERAIETQADLLGTLNDKYGDAADGANRWGQELSSVLEFQLRQSLATVQAGIAAEGDQLTEALNKLIGDAIAEAGGEADESLIPLIGRIGTFVASLADGTPDVEAFREAVAALGNNPEADAGLQALIARVLAMTEELLALDTAADDAALGLSQFNDLKLDLSQQIGEVEALKNMIGQLNSSAAVWGRGLGGGGTELLAETVTAGMNAAGEAVFGPGFTNIPVASFNNPPLAGVPGGGARPPRAQEPDFDPEEELGRITARTQALQIELDTLGMAEGAAEAYRIEQEYINEAAAAGVELSDSQIASLHAAAEGHRAITEQLAREEEQLARIAEGQRQFEQLTESFISTFVGSLMEGKSALEALGEALKQLGQQLIQMAIQQLVQRALGPLLFGGGGLGIGGGGLGILRRHGGGPVDGSGPYANVSPLLFAGAPRLHDGLAPDEFPAILQAGERVIPKGQTGGQGGTLTLVIETRPSPEFDQKIETKSTEAAVRVVEIRERAAARQRITSG